VACGISGGCEGPKLLRVSVRQRFNRRTDVSVGKTMTPPASYYARSESYAVNTITRASGYASRSMLYSALPETSGSLKSRRLGDQFGTRESGRSN